MNTERGFNKEGCIRGITTIGGMGMLGARKVNKENQLI